MAALPLIVGLGLILGLAIRGKTLLVASLLLPVALFAVALATGSPLLDALLFGALGLVAFQAGCLAGAVIRKAAGRSGHHGAEDAAAGSQDGAPGADDHPLTTTDAPFLAPRAHELDVWGSPAEMLRRLADLFRRSPGFMAITKGPDHVVAGANDAMAALVGQRPMVGRPLADAVPELAGQRWIERLDHAFGTGEPFERARTSLLLRRTGDAVEERIVDLVLEPLRDAAGAPVGVMFGGHDITDAVAAERRFRAMESLIRSTIDTLAKHVAVIAHDGSIVASNRAWKDFADHTEAGEGRTYLDACAEAADAGDPHAAHVVALVRKVLSGQAREAEVHHEDGTGPDRRWFQLRVVALAEARPTHVVLTREDITERKRSESRAAYLATHDDLTGLPNGILLKDRAGRAIGQARNERRGLALLSIDLNDFRYVNDAYGHGIGDRTLQVIAERIARGRRAEDTAARLGSDHFVVALAPAADPSMEAVRTARAILDQVAAPVTVDGHELSVTASVGISLFPDDGEALDVLLKHAEVATSRTKASGRGGYQFYSPEMSARVNERVIIETELRRALRLDRLEVHFQPQVSLEDGALVGVEALIRWQHEELGWLHPPRFVPIAEQAGLIGQLGDNVLRTACAQWRSLRREGLPEVPVAVNIAAAQLLDPGFLGLVEEILNQTGMPPRALELEITEGMVMEANETLMARLDFLRRLGVRLSIDDFGTGYSNLGYLRTFPLDRLKIDRSFVATLECDEGSQKIVRAILGLGDSFGLTVIAEGVETEEQARVLAGLGCRQAQGFLYAAPMPAADLLRWTQARAALAAHPGTA